MNNLYPDAYDKVIKLATIARFGLVERLHFPAEDFHIVLDDWLAQIVRDRQLAHDKIVIFMQSSPTEPSVQSVQFLRDNPDTVILSFVSAVKRIFSNQKDLAPQLVQIMVEFSRVIALGFGKPVAQVQLDMIAYGDALDAALEAQVEAEVSCNNFFPPSTDTRH